MLVHLHNTSRIGIATSGEDIGYRGFLFFFFVFFLFDSRIQSTIIAVNAIVVESNSCKNIIYPQQSVYRLRLLSVLIA
jgi:hypothetical protein